jgi:type IV secretion system protein VirB10
MQTDTALPPLGPIHLPAEPAQTTALDHLLGPAPLPPTTAPEIPLATTNPYASAPGTSQKTPEQLALERRLNGPVLASASHDAAPPTTEGPARTGEDAAPTDAPGTLEPAVGPSRGPANDEGTATLAALLKPTFTPAARAQLLATRRFLLPKGAFLDCTLETAISSALPGMTTCVTATDTFSADGTVVLLERGTKLVGETRGQVQTGATRLFVLWTEARTPTGVVIPLLSPGTDELGRSGLTGQIDRHWLERFGSAILITVIDGAVQGYTQSRSSNSAVVINPSETSGVATEILRNTINIPPTISKPQGDRLQILCARDVDFRSVYALRANAGTP